MVRTTMFFAWTVYDVLKRERAEDRAYVGSFHIQFLYEYVCESQEILKVNPLGPISQLSAIMASKVNFRNLLSIVA